MKQFILLLGVLSLFVFDMVGQGNLQFSRVVFLEIEGTTPSPYTQIYATTDTLIVPSGKVLKIESSSVSWLNLNSNTGYPTIITSVQGLLFLNDKIISKTEARTGYLNAIVIYPIWLNEGTYIVKLVYQSPSTGYAIMSKGFISGIEFNITPP